MIGLLLSDPRLFSGIRAVIAGDQRQTKQFVTSYLSRYKVKSVLDVGCGTGDFVTAVSPTIHYLGIDMNHRYIVFAQKNYGKARRTFTLQNVTEPAFYRGKSFDAVLLISMLHHLSDEELGLILPIIATITKKLVLVVDIIPKPRGILPKLMVALDQGRYIRTPEEKIHCLKKYFTIVHTEVIPSRLATQFGIVCHVKKAA